MALEVSIEGKKAFKLGQEPIEEEYTSSEIWCKRLCHFSNKLYTFQKPEHEWATPCPVNNGYILQVLLPGLDALSLLGSPRGGQKEGFSTLLAEGWMSEFRQGSGAGWLCRLCCNMAGDLLQPRLLPSAVPHTCAGGVMTWRAGCPLLSDVQNWLSTSHTLWLPRMRTFGMGMAAHSSGHALARISLSFWVKHLTPRP